MARRTKKPVSRLEDHLGYWLRFVSNHVSARFARLVEQSGVSVSEWVALRELFESDDTTARTLIDSLGMTKGAVSKVLDRLEHKGLIRRASDPDDGRAQRIVLTAAGRTLVPRLAALADANDAHFFGHLDAVTAQRLAAVLRDLVRTHALTERPID